MVDITLIKKGSDIYKIYESLSDNVSIFVEKIINFIKNSKNYIPPIDHESLLYNMSQISLMIDDLYKYFDIIYKTKLQYSEELLDKLFFILYSWHECIRTRYDKLISEPFCYSYILSWINICRLFFIKINYFKNIKDILNGSITNIPFVQEVSKIEHIAISPKNMIKYSLEELINNIFILYNCLYKYPYSKSINDYFDTIVFHYIKIYITNTNCFNDDFPMYFTKDSNINNNISLIYEGSQDIDYNELDIPINDGFVIKSRLIFDFELIIYPQINRFSIIKQLENKLNNNSIKYRHEKSNNIDIFYNGMLEVFQHSILNIVTNEFLKNEIFEQFKNDMSKINLRHGEQIKFTRDSKTTRQPHSDDILFKLRPNDSTIVSELKRTKITKDFIVEYRKSIENIHNQMYKQKFDNNDNFKIYQTNQPIFERETILLVYLGLKAFIKIGHISNIKIDEFFITEYIIELKSFDDIIYKMNSNQLKHPVLLNIMRHSYVIDHNTKKIFHSLFFIEAFVIWMILMIKGSFFKHIKDIAFINCYNIFVDHIILE
jgi:hypothetical protein